MKTLKYILSIIILITAVWSCNDDEFGSTDFVETAVAPTNVTAKFEISQDNSGLVTITPNSEGAIRYNIDFGDQSSSVSLKSGEKVEHVYAEGNYNVNITGYGVTGLATESTVPLTVSFIAPQNLEVLIENDLAVSKQVNVTVNADYAATFDVYFGEEGNDDPIADNVIGSTVSYQYQEPGIYTIRVVAKGAAIQTTEYTQEFEAIAIVQPIASAPIPPYRNEANVISIFSSAYNDIAAIDYNPDWGQSGQGSSYAEFDLNGDKMLQYINLSYQGVQFPEAVDVSSMEYLHMDIWTADVARIETSLISVASGEKPVWTELTADEWTSVDIPISAFTDQGLSVDDIHQLKFVGDPWAGGTVFIDNVYFWKQPSVIPTGILGTWKLAPVAGALKVGPNPNDGSWWATSEADVTLRACYFDDEYVFSPDGTFMNVLGNDTWIEGWQGGSDSCGTPVAPHDGSNAATFSYDEAAGKLTLNGVGAYIGLPKAFNGGELSNPADAPASITYDVTLSNNDTAMTVVINIGGGYWTYELIKDGEAPSSPVVGTWQVAAEAGAIGVGPGKGDMSWWAIDAAGVSDRACYIDDQYVFEADGTFRNILGSETWVEGWQGGADSCATPVAPHDGSNAASYMYDASAGKLTLNGVGAFIGLPKAFNGGELSNPADAPATITYDVEFSENDTVMTVDIWVGGEAWWRYKLVKI